MRIQIVTCSLALVFLAGCSDDDSKVCTPGVTQACTCPGGKTGAQTCEKDGSSWGKCEGCGTTTPDKGVVKKDGGGSTPDQSTNTCTPNTKFCKGTDVMMCSSSGKDSTIHEQCKNKDYATVSFTCSKCSKGVECAPTKPLITATFKGAVTYSYKYQTPPCGLPQPKKIYLHMGDASQVTGPYKELLHTFHTDGKLRGVSVLAYKMTGYAFNSEVYIEGTTPLLQITYSRMVGTTVKQFMNYVYSKPFTPVPAKGTFKVIGSSDKKGQPVKVQVDGYFTSDKGNTWEKMTYDLDGVVLGK